MSAVEEQSRGEDWSLGKGRITPQQTASLWGKAILLSRSLTTCDLSMFVQPGLVGPTCWNANISASLKDRQISSGPGEPFPSGDCLGVWWGWMEWLGLESLRVHEGEAGARGGEVVGGDQVGVGIDFEVTGGKEWGGGVVGVEVCFWMAEGGEGGGVMGSWTGWWWWG